MREKISAALFGILLSFMSLQIFAYANSAVNNPSKSWAAGFKYKQPITIENSGNALTDYQVKISLDNENFDFSRVKPDGSDIRFATKDGKIKLSYWIEKWDTKNKKAIIWVKIPTIKSGSQIIYIYYGNKNAKSESNGDSTFDFFDDFKGESLDNTKWYELGRGLLDVSGSIIHTKGEKAIYSKPYISNIFSKYIEVRGKLKGAFNNDMEVGFGIIASSSLWQGNRGGISITAIGWDNRGITINPGNCLNYSQDQLWDPTAYHTYRLKFENNRVHVWQEKSLILDQLSSCTQTIENLPVLIVFDHYSQQPNNDEYLDWIRVRKYAKIEPVAIIGTKKKKEKTSSNIQAGVFGSTKKNPFIFEGTIYYLPSGTDRLPDFSILKPIGKIYTPTLNVPTRDFSEGFPGVTDRFEWFAILYKGKIYIPKSGNYTFSLLSDDGSKLIIDNKVIIDNDGVHPPTEKIGTVYLKKGIHEIEVPYFQGPRTQVALVLSIIKNGKKEVFDIRKYSLIKMKEKECKTNLNISSAILFDFNKYNLKPQAKVALEQVVEYLKTIPYKKVIVEGHTDNRGSKSYNLQLSIKRATSVATYLISKGLSPQIVNIVGYGESKPKYPNDTEEHRAMNRRVEIKIIKPCEKK